MAHVALVGDRSDQVVAHRAIPVAIEAVAAELATPIDATWIATDAVDAMGAQALERFDAIWCVPGSPYRSFEGGLAAIRCARTRGIPFLGTCGGFQHAMIEIARDVLGVGGAAHAESEPDALDLVVTPLACALVNVEATVTLVDGSRLRAAYAAASASEEYQCRFGLDARWRGRLEAAGVAFTAFDDAGEPRGAELRGHPFFVATLFQPERAALRGRTPPLVRAFLQAALARSLEHLRT